MDNGWIIATDLFLQREKFGIVCEILEPVAHPRIETSVLADHVSESGDCLLPVAGLRVECGHLIQHAGILRIPGPRCLNFLRLLAQCGRKVIDRKFLRRRRHLQQQQQR